MKIIKVYFLMLVMLYISCSNLSDLQVNSLVQMTDAPKQVVFIIWDGAQRNHVNEMLVAGQLPVLQSTIQNGLWRDMEIRTTNCGCTEDGDNIHTETGPGHASMLTGYGFPITQNHANSAYTEKLEKDCLSICPVGSLTECYDQLGPNLIPLGLTFFERLKAFDPTVIQGLYTGKDLTFFPTPAFLNAMPPDCCSIATGLCGTGTAINECQLSRDYPSHVFSRGLAFLDRHYQEPFFLIIHSLYPDLAGHNGGENCANYSTALITNDTQTGRVLTKLTDLGIKDNTIVIITTDHGFVEDGFEHHSCVPETKGTWIVANKEKVIGNFCVNSYQTSTVPTLFDVFGMDKNVSPEFPSSSLYADW